LSLDWHIRVATENRFRSQDTAMYSFAIKLVTLLCVSALPAVADSWGPAWSLGPTKSKIISATTTLLPGNPPSQPKTLLTVWPGMSNGTGDLIQSTLEQWDDNSWCGATKSQWCVRASLFGSFGQIGESTTSKKHKYRS
jgi:hypothetical protein